MINPHSHATLALARERQKTFLAEAEAYRRAKQARSHPQRAGTAVAPRPPLRWIPRWLRPDWSRLLGHRRAQRIALGERPATGSKALTITVQDHH